MTHPTQEDDVKALKAALALDPQPWNYDPARIARLLARLEQAERDKGPWRLLTRHDHIQVGDEGLQGDCLTWLPIAGWEVGMQYAPAVLLPMRRRAATATEKTS